MFDGGSNKDELISSLTGNPALSPITSLRNQLFIKFSSDGNGVGRGFTAKITFGNTIMIYIVYHLAISKFWIYYKRCIKITPLSAQVPSLQGTPAERGAILIHLKQ